LENIKDNISEDIKELICKLPEIKNCSILCSKDNRVEEIHVLAGLNRSIKNLVRDIQSAINAAFGINIDYKVISIAQINENDLKDIRLQLNEVTVKSNENAFEAIVTITYDYKLYEGKTTKVKSKNNRFKAIAEATLLALEKYIDKGRIFYLEDIKMVAITNGELCVCVIGYTFKDKEELLSGCCLINVEEDEAVVKAILSAVNRRMSIIC